MLNYIAVFLMTLISYQSNAQIYSPQVEIFTFTEDLPKCKGGIDNITKIFNNKYVTDDEIIKTIKSLKILIDFNAKISIVESTPELDSISINSVENLFNSIDWIPAIQRQRATNFHALLKINVSKNKFVIKNILPDGLIDGSYSSKFIPKCLIESF